MATKVLDSWALIAFLEDEPAADAVEKLLTQAAAEKHKLLLSVVNWGEIYYNTMREVSQEAAEQQARAIATLPITSPMMPATRMRYQSCSNPSLRPSRLRRRISRRGRVMGRPSA